MLVAYGPDANPVVAEETQLTQLQQWSRAHTLYCPNCRGVVHLRGGPEKRTQLHFAHQKGECAWSTESESLRHMRGKSVLAHWLHSQFPRATISLEERLPEPNRIADIFVRHSDDRSWAVEFQCAPLDIEEWRKRHTAYRQAGILDIWIIGTNRREKQEAFLEAILQTTHELLFLDPQVTPPRVWLRWPIDRTLGQSWLQHASATQELSLTGWVGRLGYGATLIGALDEILLDAQGHLLHSVRTTLEARSRLLQTMSTATQPDEQDLSAFLQPRVSGEALQLVLLPLLRSYLLDPDLVRRYNYGRGLPDQPLSASDLARIKKAQAWLNSLHARGFTPEQLRILQQEIPFVGPYAAFSRYMEMLLALSFTSS
ncbi:MAG TPA: competence protein CoiA family protein [Ktedonobacteraceae bacterium]